MMKASVDQELNNQEIGMIIMQELLLEKLSLKIISPKKKLKINHLIAQLLLLWTFQMSNV